MDKRGRGPVPPSSPTELPVPTDVPSPSSAVDDEKKEEDKPRLVVPPVMPRRQMVSPSHDLPEAPSSSTELPPQYSPTSPASADADAWRDEVMSPRTALFSPPEPPSHSAVSPATFPMELLREVERERRSETTGTTQTARPGQAGVSDEIAERLRRVEELRVRRQGQMGAPE